MRGLGCSKFYQLWEKYVRNLWWQGRMITGWKFKNILYLSVNCQVIKNLDKFSMLKIWRVIPLISLIQPPGLHSTESSSPSPCQVNSLWFLENRKIPHYTQRDFFALIFALETFSYGSVQLDTIINKLCHKIVILNIKILICRIYCEWSLCGSFQMKAKFSPHI